MNPKLSILIATVGHRSDKFLFLLDNLLHQAQGKDIEIIAYWNNGEISIGNIRQDLIKEAKGEYICFIDDDDGVPDYYCEEILNNLGEDYVGFRVELFEQNRQMKPVFHSLIHQVWYDDQFAYYRGVTHLNPIRRELALEGIFSTNGAGEDASWAKSIQHLPKTEKYIDKVMYYYYHDADNTMFGGINRNKESYQRPNFEHEQFRWHPNSKEES